VRRKKEKRVKDSRGEKEEGEKIGVKELQTIIFG
jgi:hypothetical protein